MPINVSGINNTLFATPLFTGGTAVNQNNFVKEAYAVKGNLSHPESRADYGENDYRGKNVYLLA